MSEVIYHRKAAIRNTTVYAIALILAIGFLATRSSILGYVVAGVIIAWTIGGLTANVRAIRHGFKNLD